jgi:hypothetical protein
MLHVDGGYYLARDARRETNLDGVNIVGNDNQLGTVRLHEGCDVVDSGDDGEGALDGVE